jgi:hypothetical protein
MLFDMIKDVVQKASVTSPVPEPRRPKDSQLHRAEIYGRGPAKVVN